VKVNLLLSSCAVSLYHSPCSPPLLLVTSICHGIALRIFLWQCELRSSNCAVSTLTGAHSHFIKLVCISGNISSSSTLIYTDLIIS